MTIGSSVKTLRSIYEFGAACPSRVAKSTMDWLDRAHERAHGALSPQSIAKPIMGLGLMPSFCIGK